MINILMCVDGFLIVAYIMLALFKKMVPKGAGKVRSIVGFVIAIAIGILCGGVYYAGGVWLNANGFELYNIICFAFYCTPLFLIQPLYRQYKSL